MDPLNLEKVLVIDKKVDIEETYKPKEFVRKGGINKSMYVATADSYGDQLISWNNVVPPTPNTVVERSLRVRYTLTVISVYLNGADNFYRMLALDGRAGGNFGQLMHQGVNNVVLRALPLQSASTTVEAKINGTPCSMSSNDVACLYPHLFLEDEQKRFSSEFPCQKDSIALYSAVAVNSGENRSPFAMYEQNTEIPSRASYLATLVSRTADVPAAGSTTDVYSVDVTEQMVGVSPFNYGNRMNDTGLSNLNNLTVSIKIADIQKCLSVCAPPANGQTVTCTVQNSRPSLLIEYITPDPIIAAKMPSELIYDYEQVTPYPTPILDQLTWQAGALQYSTVTANALRLSSIPSRIYIYAKPRKQWLGTGANPVVNNQIPDTFLGITGLNIVYNNRIGLFSTFTAKDLYKMSVANGLQDSFQDFTYATGSVVIIDVQKDICLDSDEDTGQSNRYSTLQAFVTVNNAPLCYANNTLQVAYDLYMTVVLPGKCLVTKSSCELLLAGVSASEVLALSANPELKVHEDDANKHAQGSGFGRLGKLLHSGLSIAKTALHHIKPEHIEFAQKALKHIGIGGSVSAGSMVAGKVRHRRAY